MSEVITETASGDQLRRLWTNLKSRQRENLTKERQYRLATGGGGPCPDANVDPDIADVAPALLVEISDAVDSDTIGLIPSTITEDQPSTSTSLPSASASQPLTSTNLPLTTTSQPSTSTSQPLTPTQSFTYTVQPVQPSSHSASEEFSTTNEKKLRIQILTKEHLSRTNRADEKHKIEMLILEQQLLEAKYKTELAAKQLGHK